MQKYWVTTALTYANGSLHLGHLVEQIQADIWVRFLRLKGHEVTFVSGADAHGTPIMLKAEQEGVAPEQLVMLMQRKHIEITKRFFVAFDCYDITHSEENKSWVEWVYAQLVKSDLIHQKTVLQAYDSEKEMFLPDRYVKGGCPKCGAADQYGDNCDVCGASYGPRDLLDPYSSVSGKPIEYRNTKHFFLSMQKYEQRIGDWIQQAQMPEEVKHKLSEWFDAGLKDWDISRDAPYFGFKIPDSDQYFYVWVDAPVGYLAALSQMLGRDHVKDVLLSPQRDVSIHHFIGKDIVFFHGVFWPALLIGSGLTPPDALNVHGFLTINGQKMSKSRGTFIAADEYLEQYDPEFLRYYLASKLNQSIVDINLCWDDFKQKNNTDVVNKVINIGSRCASFVHKYFNGMLSDVIDEELVKYIEEKSEKVATYFDERRFSDAMKEIMHCADETNRYIDQHKPWVMIKEDDQRTNVHQIVSSGIQSFFQLMVMLSPVLPETAKKVFALLNIDHVQWDTLYEHLGARSIKPFGVLKARVQ
ncbi:MAG: methionine--tRNA ligase [Candidatus Comchoanobacterales bacterium]